LAATRFQIRPATAGDMGAVAGLAAELAQSFTLSRARFEAHYPELLAAGHACLLVASAAPQDDCLGYLLGFDHLTFYANGRVAWVEELVVRNDHRGQGIGRALMNAFEAWARNRGCALVALATRRAAPFYQALGYQESAAYLRKLLDDQQAR
jgi:GNAT superfamily N-acetyltransferase